MSKRILFFIDHLHCGGRERRFVELIQFMKQYSDFDLKIVITEEKIHYRYVIDSGIPIIILKRRWFRKDPSVFFRFLKIAKDFKPDIIHTWGTMTTIYSIPSKLSFKCVVVSNLISNATNKIGMWSLSNMFFKISCYFSDVIISNSEAGKKAYNLNNNKKVTVICNGVNMDRFSDTIDKNSLKERIQVNTRFMVIMVASMSNNKDYDLFLDVAKKIGIERTDITFVGVGDGNNFKRIQNRIKSEKIFNVILTGLIEDVEPVISLSDIGVLFTHSEGISNSIIEYMALGKPVLTTDMFGGSQEILENEKSGYIIERNVDLISGIIIQLLENDKIRKTMGEKGKKIIENRFTITSVGQQFINIYNGF